jgi:hypothetical protein
MITVDVQGHGSFVIAGDKLNELLAWLAKNSMPVEVNVRKLHGDDTLLNG